MTRSLLLGLTTASVFGGSIVTAWTADYLVRVDAIGYVDAVDADEPPEEAVLHSIEVLSGADAEFHGRVRLGKELLVLTGKLEASEEDEGELTIRLDYRHSADRGVFVLTADGERQSVPDETSIEVKSMSVEPGKLRLLGERTIRQLPTTRAAGRPAALEAQSKVRYVLLVLEYQDEDDED
jgi:hypothetical protein